MSDNPLIGHGNNYYGNTDPLGRVGETPQQQMPIRAVNPPSCLVCGEEVEHADNCSVWQTILALYAEEAAPTATPEQGNERCWSCGYGMGGTHDFLCRRYIDKNPATGKPDPFPAKQPSPAPLSLADVPRYRAEWGQTSGLNMRRTADGEYFEAADIEALVQRLEKENAKDFEIRMANAGLLRVEIERREQAEASLETERVISASRLSTREIDVKVIEAYQQKLEAAEASLQQIRGVLQAGLDRDIDDTTTYGLANVAVNGLAWAREENAKLRESLQQLLIENKRLREDAFVRPSQLDDFEEGDPDS